MRPPPRRGPLKRGSCAERQGWVCKRFRPRPTKVVRCFDSMDDASATAPDSGYYESIDFDDAHHVQTILAYELKV